MNIPSLTRPVKISLSIFAVLASLDFILRVAVWSDGSNRTKPAPAVLAPAPGDSSEVILKRLSQWVPVEPASNKAMATSADAFALQAVFVGRQGSRAVLALRGPGGQITRHVRVGEGDQVEGWRVGQIQSRKVILQRDDTEHELVLFKRAVAAAGGG